MPDPDRLVRLAAVRGLHLMFSDDGGTAILRPVRPGHDINIADAVDFLADHFPDATVRANSRRYVAVTLNPISAEPDHGQDHPDC